MPPRFAVAGIVAFWLATTGYVLHRDVWPRLFASGPPPVTIELADEARQNVPARWTIYRNGEKAGKLTTQMKYDDSADTFQFTYRYTELALSQGEITLLITEGTSDVRMTRAGDLKEQSLSAKVKVLMKATPKPREFAEGTIDVRGVVNNGILTGRAQLTSNWGEIAGDLDPVPVPRGSQPLNPLQPVNRIGHVHGGQVWEVHESNPLQHAVGNLLRRKVAEVGLRLPEEKEKESLVAEVSSSPQTLAWQGQEVACWVIEYRRKEVVARTWVAVKDGKVLRQEAFEKGESLTFERED
jgi:hypothetical protein